MNFTQTHTGSRYLLVALGFTLMSHVQDALAKENHVKVDSVTQSPVVATETINGTVYSHSHNIITAGISAQLEWIIEPGEFVAKGDTVATLDVLPLQLKKREQQAQIKRGQINSKYLQSELQRLEKLRKTSATSQLELDRIRSQSELAKAELEINQIKLEQIQDQIQRAQIKAPFDGTITQRFKRSGEDINRSDKLLKILDTQNLEARLQVPVKYINFVAKGDYLAVEHNGISIEAQISAKILSADPLSQSFEVRLTLPEPMTHQWTSGQLVKIKVPVEDKRTQLTVSRDALLLRQNGTYVVKVDEQNTAHRLLVKVGKGNHERVAIEGDLSSGDRVAVRGAERLSDGQTVTIVN